MFVILYRDESDDLHLVKNQHYETKIFDSQSKAEACAVSHRYQCFEVIEISV